MEEKKSNARKEIINLSLLFLFSFLTAGLIAGYLILNYGPTGLYNGKNTVLAPDVLNQLNFADKRTGSPFKILFDKIAFTFFDKKTNTSKSLNIDTQGYTRFYLTIANDESIDELKIPHALFDKSAASITIYTKPEKALKGEEAARAFQRIEFSQDGDHYRVELIGDSDSIWAYFMHKGILEKTMKIFIP